MQRQQLARAAGELTLGIGLPRCSCCRTRPCQRCLAAIASAALSFGATVGDVVVLIFEVGISVQAEVITHLVDPFHVILDDGTALDRANGRLRRDFTGFIRAPPPAAIVATSGLLLRGDESRVDIGYSAWPLAACSSSTNAAVSSVSTAGSASFLRNGKSRLDGRPPPTHARAREHQGRISPGPRPL